MTSDTNPSPFRAVLRDRTLRRLQYAVVGSVLGRFAFTIALLVWAYDEGGAGLVGLTGFLRLAPGAVSAPFAAPLVDRHRRDHVMIASDLARAVLAAGAAAAVGWDLGPVVVLTLVGLISVAGSVFEPARAAFTPSLVDDPALLTATNAVSSAVNSAGYFLGPALGGLLLTVSSTEVVFLFTAAACLGSVLAIAMLKPRRPQEVDAEAGGAGWLAELREGVATVREDPGVRWLFLLFGLQTLITGATGVLVVLVALEALDAGEEWVGYLNGLMGIGALLGVPLIARVLKGGRLSTASLAGIALWGFPFLVLGTWETRGIAVAATLLSGIGDTAIDVAAITLLQRIVPEALLGRVFGLLEAVCIGGIAAGALLAPLAVSALGLDGALVLFGATPVLALLGLRTLRHVDARAAVDERPRALLRGLEVFSVLPLPTLDGLATALEPVAVPAGATVFRQGDSGDRYYVIDEGQVEVEVDGTRRRTLGPGEAFGEIALLRDVPRTATVVASSPVKLLALDRDRFLGAVTGHAGTALNAEAVVSRYASRRAAPVPA